MAIRRVHIGNLKIRMSRATGDPPVLAAEIGREVMHAAARLSKGKAGRIEIKEIPIGKIAMSDNVGKQIASTLSRRLDRVMYGGKK